MRVGELRSVVEEESALAWSVNDRLRDEQQVPEYPLGAIPSEALTEARELPPLDLPSVLGDIRPANPMLARRQERLGILYRSGLLKS